MDSMAQSGPSDQQSHSPSMDQSIAIVRMFLNATIGCIAYTRELIPWQSSCFQTRYADQLVIKSVGSDKFSIGYCERKSESNRKSQEFRTLRSGKDERADSVLDMIESSVIATLKRRHLKAFQMFITTDTTGPAAILEVYTFSFTYNEDNITELKVSVPDIATFSTEKVVRSFGSSIKTLLRSMQGLPQLPRRRSLGITLTYNGNCPQSYQPAGFADIKTYRDGPLQGCWADLWQNGGTGVADFQSNLCAMSVGLRNLQFVDGITHAQLKKPKLSVQVHETSVTDSQNQDSGRTNDNIVDLTTYNPSINDRTTQSMLSNYGSTTMNERRIPNNQIVTDIPDSRKAVNRLAKLSVAYKNRRRRNVVPEKIAELMIQAKSMEHSHPGIQRLFDKAMYDKGKIKRLNRLGLVKCECGSSHEATNLLLCELCGTNQHSVCYSYETIRQGSLPEEHFCYSCLLLPREEKTSWSMKGLVHMRLALCFLAKQHGAQVGLDATFRTSVFGDQEISTSDFPALVDRLVKEEYVFKTRPDMVVIMGNKNKVAEAQTYLDPLASIAHHYQVVRDSDTPRKRKEDILRALKVYVGGRTSFGMGENNSCFDCISVKDFTGQEVIRWGSYTHRKRMRDDSPDRKTPENKMSISRTFICMNRSSSSEGWEMDNALQGAVGEAEWSLKTALHLDRDNTEFE